MSVCFLARHLASLKSQRHAQRTQACTHTQTHSHAHRLWRALTFIILWMSGTYSSYTWYLNCAHYSNCCLQFANIFSCWVAETVRGEGGTFHWHSECPFWGTQDGARSPWQRIHQSMWWELEEELWQLFCRWLVFPSASLSLPLLPPLLPVPLRFICFTIFFNYFNATNMSAYFVLKGIFPVSAQRFFLFLWLSLLPVYDTRTPTHTCKANCVTV